MWLTSSSVGRKFVMAVSGAALLLFVTFHCLLNAIAICWPTAYNSVCEFLGANWYALLASVALAALIVIHIIYACILTMQNRKARGSKGYSISKRPATVEWSSKNMMVLGIVILAFLVVHLIQFWARMQLQEIRGTEEMLPPAAGTLFIQEAFGTSWTAIVYIIGFVALWFHLTHGFWSMFQSVGWDSTVWIPRLKKIGMWWISIVCLCFTAQAIVFTIKAHQDFYKTNPELRAQYQEMYAAMYERDFGPDAAVVVPDFKLPFDEFSQQLSDSELILKATLEFTSDEEFNAQIAELEAQKASYETFNPQYALQIQARIDQLNKDRKLAKELLPKVGNIRQFYNYLEGSKAVKPSPMLQMQYDMEMERRASGNPQM